MITCREDFLPGNIGSWRTTAIRRKEWPYASDEVPALYLDRDCVVMPGYGKTKNARNGCGSWALWHTKHNTDSLKKNAKVRKGTGGLLIVDVDPRTVDQSKHCASGSLAFPTRGPSTRSLSTLTDQAFI